jgi:hypothetical protein
MSAGHATEPCSSEGSSRTTWPRTPAPSTSACTKDCRWLKRVLMGRFEFVEWTPDKHLRYSRFAGLRQT